MNGVTLMQAMALGLPCSVLIYADGVGFAVRLLLALFVCVGWEMVFAVLRRREFSLHGVTTALIVAVLVPSSLPIWELALVLSLGVTLGELVFGGRGFGFLQPATVAVALLVFSFPQSQLDPSSQDVAIATLPGAALLVVFGLVSWRTILGVCAGLAGFLAFAGQAGDPTTIAVAATFGLVFLICDPIAGAVTNQGRWVYGVLAGGLIVLFSTDGLPTTQAVVFAALLASVFAPLIDHLVVLGHAKRRARANG